MQLSESRFSFVSAFAALALAALSFGCESGGVGDPCTPEEEYLDNFTGFSLGEVSVQSRSYECETRVCLVNKFQGRVSCPYGTNGSEPVTGVPNTVDHNLPCELPGFEGTVKVPVLPQLIARRPDVAVYCSCRCAGPDPNARYCECPSGFQCADIGVRQGPGQGNEQQEGSYCIRTNTDVDPDTVDTDTCSVPAAGETPGINDLTCGDPPSPVSG